MNGFIDLLLSNMMMINPGNLPPVDVFNGTCGLTWSQITAIAKCRNNITAGWIAEFAVMTGKRVEKTVTS